MNLTAKLLTDQQLAPETLGKGGCELLLRELQADDIDRLGADLAEQAIKAAAVIDAALADGTDPDGEDDG
jgi:glutamate-ammonia-ligase adenylyltransferase